MKKIIGKTGYQVSKISPSNNDIARRRQILELYGINTVLDVGANSGQFSTQMRKDVGYQNRIISFEPLSSAFHLLKQNSERDQQWEVHHCALGAKDEQVEINISRNSYGSSILDVTASQIASVPGTTYIDKETISSKRLDSIFEDLNISHKGIYLKIDTQGYERYVLEGAENSLSKIDTVQMEMSLIPLYKGELLMHEMCSLMYQKGYVLIAVENGFSDEKTGQLMQVDGIFHRC